MKKKIYMIPCTSTITIVAEHMVAESLSKGEGNFNPEEMTFTKNQGSWNNLWNDTDNDDE